MKGRKWIRAQEFKRFSDLGQLIAVRFQGRSKESRGGEDVTILTGRNHLIISISTKPSRELAPKSLGRV